MQKIIAYNFPHEITPESDFHTLYTKTHRGANFAAAYKLTDGSYLAVRDHLGTVPLYYRRDENGKTKWSCSYNDLLEEKDTLTKEALLAYLGFPSAKVTDLIPDIKRVSPGTALHLSPTGETKTLYTYKMTITPVSGSRREIVHRLDELLEQAVVRTIIAPKIGLYLSGGMDSGMMGYHLKKHGVEVHAYTALPWGTNGTEYKYSQINAELIGVDEHHFVDVETAQYADFLKGLPELYRTPHGTTTAFNVAAIWNGSPIATEQQLSFAQNTDTFTSSVSGQVNTFLAQCIPQPLRKMMTGLPHQNIITNYLHVCSRGKVLHHEHEAYINTSLGWIAQLAQAGMYIAHSQADSESMTGPSVARGQLITNPYYDMDLIEFYLGIAPRHKLSLNRHARGFVTIEKNLLREVAVKHFPAELVYRKKGFVLPKQRDERSAAFYNQLSDTFEDLVIKDQFEKLSYNILAQHLAIKT